MQEDGKQKKTSPELGESKPDVSSPEAPFTVRFDKNEEPPDGRLQFEMLLSELSTAFINAPYDQIDGKIEHALQRLVKHLEFERGSLYQLRPKGTQITHSWAVEGLEPLQLMLIPEKELPWFNDVVKIKKQIVVINSLDDLPPEAARDKEYLRKRGPLSMVTIPLVVGGETIGTVGFGSVSAERTIPLELIQRARLIGVMFSNALQRKKSEEALHHAYSEIKTLKDQMQAECGYLREEIELSFKHGEIIGKSQAILRVLTQIERVAPTESTVLLTGETGTGKELMARAIHNISARKDRAMVKLNCSALPPTLVESELFGREKGAYTGALTKQMGRFEIANGSTIFLDEIGELPMELQAKLLRVIQEGQFERLGSSKTIAVNVRLIAATNRDLAKAVQEGLFREDLYYRLNVFPISAPPLRERREDIPLLVWAFVKEFEQIMNKNIERIAHKNMEALQKYIWPGNIRELRNLIERAMIVNQGPLLEIDIPDIGNSSTFETASLEEMERRHIIAVLKQTGWRIRGKHGAAEILCLKPTTLDSKIKKLGLPRRPAPSELS